MGALDYVGDPLMHTKLLLHPAHGHMTEIVTKLITEVRAAGDRSGLREPQEHMLGYLLEAERLFSVSHRLTKRGGGDELELTFWRRARTQLKSVGDAVAWRFLGYRRQQIIFLGGNQPPGLISGKLGSEAELAAFVGHWDAREPAVLTGLRHAKSVLVPIHARDEWASAAGEDIA